MEHSVELSKSLVTATLRLMEGSDLGLVETWLAAPHVAQWYLAGSTLEEQLADLRESVRGGAPTVVMIASERGRPIGWCQWYLCDDYPEHAHGVGAHPGDVGIDFAIGEPGSLGRGLGAALVAALVHHVRAEHPEAGIIADPEATNRASRRVLERNGFQLLGERSLATEATSALVALYRQAPVGR